MHAHLLAQVEPPSVGIHLMWSGPRPWVYSPKGWFIQRRKAQRNRPKPICDELTPSRIAWLRQVHLLVLTLGEFTLRRGDGLASLDPKLPTGSFDATDCEVITLELNEPQNRVRVDATAKLSFVLAKRDGKVVASATTVGSGQVSHELTAVGIDKVVLYALAPDFARFCSLTASPEDWKNEPYIVKELQLPLRELMPTLADSDAEFAEAKSRLLPGETLDRPDFERLAESLRVAIRGVGPPRPLDQTLLLREDPAVDFEEIAALDPIRVLLSHPKWRRVLGFGWFDNDPALVPGEAYEYRITGFFPGGDLIDNVYGFHTVPSQTSLPAEFYLHDVRVRLPQPTQVKRGSNGPNTGRAQVTRRGIRLRPQDQFFWLLPSLDDWSAVFDFPAPVSSIVLELEAGHALEYSAGHPNGPFVTTITVPPGERPRLNFSTPITQLRIRGSGFVQALRVPAPSTAWKEASVDLPAITLADAPRPLAPLFAEIANLQEAQDVSSNDVPTTANSARNALGFKVKWRPTPMGGVTQWPPNDPPPPIDAALFEIEHREQGAATWSPVLPDENWTFGDRDDAINDTAAFPGVDLMQLFPEVRQPGPGLDCNYRDVFDFKEGGGEVRRPLPAPGTHHQYRVRSVDPIGRPSLTWSETGVLRLEKHAPPPVPVGPSETPADQVALPEPMGVQARVLVKDAPDLTSTDLGILGDDDNAIILRWGWRQQQRDQDPFAREFRVYVADRALDAVGGELVGVTQLSLGRYEIEIVLERTVAADAAKGLRIAAGQTFRIESHTAGSAITAVVDVHVPGPDGQLPTPAIGPVLLPLRLTPNLTRAAAWSERFEVVPITSAVVYQSVIRNRLTLNANQPRDTIWVGVSSADDQFYVPDPLAPLQMRPGNEGAIVPVACVGRYHGRPIFDVPPALDPVPVLIGPEPSDRPAHFDLDLAPFLTGSGLGPGQLVRPERADGDAVFAACFATADGRVMGRVLDQRDSETVQEIVIPNPSDRAAVVSALESGLIEDLDDRFMVFLSGSHPYRDRLFAPATPQPIQHARFVDTLPPRPARYVYRVRKSDAAGHLSAGGAVAAVIVRVPSLAVPAPPERLPGEGADPPGTLRLMTPDDAELTHMLTFQQALTNGVLRDGGELLRIPNRPDLYPADGVRLRAPNGELLVAQVKDLADPDVIVDADGVRRLVMSFTAGPGEGVRVWACSLSRDGVPSRLAGPWGLAMPVAALPTPMLTVSGSPPALNFSWSCPTGPRHTVALQRSANGREWTRVSPLLAESVTSHVYAAPPGAWKYRLLVKSPDGRASPGNIVEA